MGLLDGVFGGGGDDKSKKKAGGGGDNKNNPLANAFSKIAKGNHPKSFQGQGKSLGGSKPGEVIAVTFSDPGPLGLRVEKKSNTSASAIINQVVPGSQAEAAGLQRGDILCFSGSNGQEEIMYDMFLQLAQSGQRPLREYYLTSERDGI
jgi:predicted metalloprotease with PDZ domain